MGKILFVSYSRLLLDGYPLKTGHLKHPFAERSRSEQAGWLRLHSSANGHAVPSKTGADSTKGSFWV